MNQITSTTSPSQSPNLNAFKESLTIDSQTTELINHLKSVYRTYNLQWIQHCDAIDRLRARINQKKRTPLTAPILDSNSSNTNSIDLPQNILNLPLNSISTSLSNLNPSSASLTAPSRTTRRNANSTSFGIGDAVTDAQFDFVLAQLGTADQKDPNNRAMKTTAFVPDMALTPAHQSTLLSTHSSSDDSLVSDPIAFYNLNPISSEQHSTSASIWSQDERELFQTSYTQQPKQFGWIAAQICSKTRAECVTYYYRTKLTNKYRNLHLLPSLLNDPKPRDIKPKRSRKTNLKTNLAASLGQTLDQALKSKPKLPHQHSSLLDSFSTNLSDDLLQPTLTTHPHIHPPTHHTIPSPISTSPTLKSPIQQQPLSLLKLLEPNLSQPPRSPTSSTFVGSALHTIHRASSSQPTTNLHPTPRTSSHSHITHFHHPPAQPHDSLMATNTHTNLPASPTPLPIESIPIRPSPLRPASLTRSPHLSRLGAIISQPPHTSDARPPMSLEPVPTSADEFQPCRKRKFEDTDNTPARPNSRVLRQVQDVIEHPNLLHADRRASNHPATDRVGPSNPQVPHPASLANMPDLKRRAGSSPYWTKDERPIMQESSKHLESDLTEIAPEGMTNSEVQVNCQCWLQRPLFK